MKKNDPHYLGPGKNSRLGPVCLRLLVVTCLVASHLCPVWGQGLPAFATLNRAAAHDQKKINLQLENQSLYGVLDQLAKESDAVFIYANDDIDVNRKVSLRVQDVLLDNALGILFTPLGIAFERHGNKVVLSTKTAPRPNTLNALEGGVKAPRSLAFSSPRSQTADITLTGRVSSAQGEPLPGVTVILKGTTVGASTDPEGRYSLTVPDGGGMLVFSFIGFSPKEIAVPSSGGVLNVTLVEDAKALDEVVVVGYGTQKKITTTGSVTTVQGADIAKAPVTNVSNALAGRLPGVSTVQRSGEPGADGSAIRIRGVNTLGNNDALIVVDGVPGRSLDRIDPNSIESINVLKDASAAIYGSQAANGVILVTTKRGKVGKPVVTINVNQGYNQPTRVPKMANGSEYATLLNEIDLYQNRPQRYSAEEVRRFTDGSDPWRYPNTDWFGEVLKPWSGQNNMNASMSGGTEQLRYYLSLGSKFQDGYYYNSATNYKQYDFRSNIDGKISDNVSIGFDVFGRMENRNQSPVGAGTIFRTATLGNPNIHAYWPDGTPGPDIIEGNNPVVVSTGAAGIDNNKVYAFNSSLKLNVKVPWVEGLSLSGSGNLDKSFQYRKLFQTPWYVNSWDGQTFDANNNPVLKAAKTGLADARLTEYMQDNQSLLFNGIVNYEKTFDRHAIKLMAGMETREGKGNNFNAFR
jgi:TonB-linked SusC/RagA family outer membrane protein